MRPKKNQASAARSFSRRVFLESSLKLGAASLALPALAGERAAELPAVAPFELDESTVADLQAGMKSGKFTSRSLTEKYLQRIEEIDRGGPTVRSVIETNPDAVSIADSLDAERKSKGPRGPLHGIPVLIKDNIGTADRMMTTAGSLALLGSVSAKDSGVARRLREAGAVILGKANLSEWANYRSTHSSSGWSGRGGQTNNPYALDRNPCGSSSGSGAAAAANLCAVAVGTETDGSVVCPSSINGIVGIKPTVGLISRAGIVPISHTQDTAGPMCRTVTDAAILLGALAGTDPADSATAASRGKARADYTRFLDPNGLRGARIGIVRKYFEGVGGNAAVFDAALDVLKHQGAVVVDPADIPTIGKWDDSEAIVLSYEFKHNLNAYLAEYAPNAQVHTLKDLIEFNERNREREMPYFGQEQFLQAEARGPLTDKTYLDALALDGRLARGEGIDAVMDKYKLDALVAPTAGPAWLTDWVDGDHDTSGSSSAAAIAGYPSITVPAGFVFGLPVGISIFGRAWSEPKLIAIAYAFEQATKVRKPPRFLSTVNLHQGSS
ncbi:MAG TPA: amidase [Candidatus Acidoferrales bacterium]|nr:amidase [Candidatus Acidoferrales bacterium]